MKNDKDVSKVKLAIGAASLFLFLIGIKRSFRTEEGEIRVAGRDPVHDK